MPWVTETNLRQSLHYAIIMVNHSTEERSKTIQYFICKCLPWWVAPPRQIEKCATATMHDSHLLSVNLLIILNLDLLESAFIFSWLFAARIDSLSLLIILNLDLLESAFIFSWLWWLFAARSNNAIVINLHNKAGLYLCYKLRLP